MSKIGNFIIALCVVMIAMSGVVAASETRTIENQLILAGESTVVAIVASNDFSTPEMVEVLEEIPSGWRLEVISDENANFIPAPTIYYWGWNDVAPGTIKTIVYRLIVPESASPGEYSLSGVGSEVGGDCVINVISSTMARSFAPLISSVDPSSGDSGTRINIHGSRFIETSRVFFTDKASGQRTDAKFLELSRNYLKTVVPDGIVRSQWLVSLFTPLGGTVTIPPGFINITSDFKSGSGSSVYVVRNGGTLTGGFGSSTVFVESGGIYNNIGGGSNTVYVQANGSYIGHDGGGNAVFAEPSAIVPGDIALTKVRALKPSYLP